MIFSEFAGSEEIKRWLLDNKANWLLQDTQAPGLLELAYLNKNNELNSYYLILIKKKWVMANLEDLEKLNNKKDIIDVNAQVINDRAKSLQNCIYEILSVFVKKDDCLIVDTIRGIPSLEEITKSEDYNYYQQQQNEIIRPKPSGNLKKLEFNPDNWIHKLVLENCLTDPRLYLPIKEGNKVFCAATSACMTKIRNELLKLLNNETVNFTEMLLEHPYYLNIKEAFDRRANQIIEELKTNIKNKNQELIRKFNQFRKEIYKASKIRRNENPSITLDLSDKKIQVFIASCQGDRSYQEDYANVMAYIKLHSSWVKRIPELLLLTVQSVVAKIYQKYAMLLRTKSVGATLAYVFIHDNYVYLASLGDSPIVLCNRTTQQASYLYYPQRSYDRIDETEQTRVEAEGGIIGAKSANDIPRLNRRLAVTRAIGDRVFSNKGMSDIPQINLHQLPDQAENCCIILGSDGLTDYLSLKAIAEIVQNTKPNQLAEVLCAEAWHCSPSKRADNITVVCLNKLQNGLFANLHDGHSSNEINEVNKVSAFANQLSGELFRQIAESPAPAKIKDLDNMNYELGLEGAQTPPKGNFNQLFKLHYSDEIEQPISTISSVHVQDQYLVENSTEYNIENRENPDFPWVQVKIAALPTNKSENNKRLSVTPDIKSNKKIKSQTDNKQAVAKEDNKEDRKNKLKL